MKKIQALILALALALSLAACFGGGSSADINVYYKNGTSNVLSPEVYEYKGEETTDAMARFAIEKLIEGPKSQGNAAVLPEGTKLNFVKVRESEANVDFSSEFTQCEGVDELLARFSVVSTLCDIEGIESVLITIDGESLISKGTGKEVGALRKSDIVYDTDDFTQQPGEKTSVKLYFPTSDAMYLAWERRSVETQNSLSMEKTVITELLKGPESENLIAVIPSDVKVLNVETNNGVCFVNFSSDFVSKFTGGTSTGMFIVYSIVNSLCELDDVDSVQILIEGKAGAEFGDFVFDEPLEANMSIVKK